MTRLHVVRRTSWCLLFASCLLSGFGSYVASGVVEADTDAVVEPDPKLLYPDFPWEIEPKCFKHKRDYYFRQYDGSCNWIKKGESHLGSSRQPFFRDFNQTSYSDNISAPRHGPNARELSNIFFKRDKVLQYDRSSMLLAVVELVIHDLQYSQSGSNNEFIEVNIPTCDAGFDPNCTGTQTMTIPRTKHVQGTGTATDNPRQHENGATAWLDLSIMYGNDEYTNHRLRTLRGGKLKSQIGADGLEALPFNSVDVGVENVPRSDDTSLLAGGDPRTNENWLILSLHTLLLREHNRLCDLLSGAHADWDDETIFQAARELTVTKYGEIVNQYALSYGTGVNASSYSLPLSDGFYLYRVVTDTNFFQLNGIHTWPWAKTMTPYGQPMQPSQEESIGYRFHDLIVKNFSLVDSNWSVVDTVSTLRTQYDAKGFLNTDLSLILRGMMTTLIPNFRSGVEEDFRTAKFGKKNFDLVTWSIVHERERGVPTFNNYFREYNKVYKLQVPIRTTFAEFTSNVYFQQQLQRLYATPDDVDLLVGLQLDETLFPGTSLPTSRLVVSLLSLIGTVSSDRFGAGYAFWRCILVEKPWDCTPTTILEELLWHSYPLPFFPRARIPNWFWLREIQLHNAGKYQLWNLITMNSNVKCAQMNPLFPADATNNPVVCRDPQAQFPMTPDDGRSSGVLAFLLTVIIVVITVRWCLQSSKK